MATRPDSNEPMSEAKPTKLLTTVEVAALLGVRTSWVYDRARNGGIPHVRLGRHVRFRLEAVEAWIEELEASSKNGPPPRRR
jgi:excisionase family DNA binding protein